MPDRWVKRWSVPSESKTDLVYTVAVDADGIFGCSCPSWTRNRKRLQHQKCKHIRQVEAGRWPEQGNPIPDRPTFTLAHVLEVTPVRDVDIIVEVLVPLIPIGDTDFIATVIYDCLRYGISWKELQRYNLAKHNSRSSIIEHVRAYGRSIYKRYKSPHGRRCVPVPASDGL